MALNLLPGCSGKQHLRSSLAGCPVVPSLSKASPRRASHAAFAKRQTPNWKLEKPNRLWELGEVWYPGATAPSYLDASLPGDRGFDPLRLAENDELRPWLVEAELYNGRWAMAGVVGMLWVEVVGRGPWGSAPFRTNWVLPYTLLIVLFHVVYGTFEYFRWINFQKKGETGLLAFAPFDPLGLSNDYLRQSEVRNGRLAMLAALGFFSQAAITRKSPLENLFAHLDDPGHNNIMTSGVGREVTLLAVVIGILPTYLESRRSLVPKDQQDEPFRPFPFLSPDKY